MLLELNEAGRVYDGRQGAPVTALHPTTLAVSQGEFVCLSGPSGSGKTTLLNLMAIIDAPTSGVVRIAGRATGDFSRTEAARFRLRHIGLVFQELNLIPVLSARENVEYALLLQGMPARRRRERIQYCLDLVGLSELGERRPGELSGGQQQRVAIARSIATSPPLILADEPTASLDSTSGRSVLDLLRRLNRDEGTTFVFSSHDPRIIDRADRVVALEDGRIVSDGSPGPA